VIRLAESVSGTRIDRVGDAADNGGIASKLAPAAPGVRERDLSGGPTDHHDPGPSTAPAEELATPYHERREIETALDGLKTHLRGAQIVLRSKTPELVRQEFYGLLLAHYAIRGLIRFNA
jgi:hypothetical protein